MRNWVIIIFIVGFGLGGRTQCVEDFEGFTSFLGTQDSEVLNVINHSFDTILQSEYPDIPDFEDRIRIFLKNFVTDNFFPPRFYSDSASFKKLKNQLESNGFRKDIYLYDEENYEQNYDLNEFIPESDEPEPTEVGRLNIALIEAEIMAEWELQGHIFEEYDQDSTYLFNDRPELEFYMNPHGKFWYGLAKYSCSDVIIDVIESIKNQNRISIGVVAGGMEGTDLKNPFIRQAVVAQFYIWAILRFGYSETQQ